MLSSYPLPFTLHFAVLNQHHHVFQAARLTATRLRRLLLAHAHAAFFAVQLQLEAFARHHFLRAVPATNGVNGQAKGITSRHVTVQEKRREEDENQLRQRGGGGLTGI